MNKAVCMIGAVLSYPMLAVLFFLVVNLLGIQPWFFREHFGWIFDPLPAWLTVLIVIAGALNFTYYSYRHCRLFWSKREEIANEC